MAYSEGWLQRNAHTPRRGIGLTVVSAGSLFFLFYHRSVRPSLHCDVYNIYGLFAASTDGKTQSRQVEASRPLQADFFVSPP